MAYIYRLASLNILLGALTFMAAVTANASLLDCAKATALELPPAVDCLAPGEPVSQSSYHANQVPAALPELTPARDFQINPMNNSQIPGSAPLLAFTCTLLAVLLVRARACNTK